MTYQYLTVPMFNNSKENGGFVDQTEFKTVLHYNFNSLYLIIIAQRLLTTTSLSYALYFIQIVTTFLSHEMEHNIAN